MFGMTSLRVRNASDMVGLSAKFVTGEESMAKACDALGLTGADRRMNKMKGKGINGAKLRLQPDLVPEKPNGLGTGVCILQSRGSVGLGLGVTSSSPHIVPYGVAGMGILRTTTQQGLGWGSVAEFKFMGEKYFSNDNTHHFAVILRGKLTDTALMGKGIIIGSVQRYGGHSGVCKPTTKPNTIAFESFWDGGNCVFGDITGSPTLVDGVIYSVRVIANSLNKTISVGVRSSDGLVWTSQIINDPFFDNSGGPLEDSMEFAIGAVGDTRQWKMHLGDIVYYNIK